MYFIKKPITILTIAEVLKLMVEVENTLREDCIAIGKLEESLVKYHILGTHYVVQIFYS